MTERYPAHTLTYYINSVITWLLTNSPRSFATIGLIIAMCHFLPRLARWMYKAYAPTSLRIFVEKFRELVPLLYRLLFVALPGNMPLFLWLWLHRTAELPMDFGLLVSQVLPSLVIFTVVPAIVLDFVRAMITKFLFKLRIQDPMVKKAVRCLAYIISPCDMTEISGPKIVDEPATTTTTVQEKPVVVEKREIKRGEEGLRPETTKQEMR
jgi:hypothetical protein